MTGSDITHVLTDFPNHNKKRKMGPPGRIVLVIGSSAREKGLRLDGGACGGETHCVRIAGCGRIMRICECGVRCGSVIGSSCCLPCVCDYAYYSFVSCDLHQDYFF
jgi:hypothetical protein